MGGKNGILIELILDAACFVAGDKDYCAIVYTLLSSFFANPRDVFLIIFLRSNSIRPVLSSGLIRQAILCTLYTRWSYQRTRNFRCS